MQNIVLVKPKAPNRVAYFPICILEMPAQWLVHNVFSTSPLGDRIIEVIYPFCSFYWLNECSQFFLHIAPIIYIRHQENIKGAMAYIPYHTLMGYFYKPRPNVVNLKSATIIQYTIKGRFMSR